MEKGFYKNDNGSLLYAPSFVSGPGFELLAVEHESYTYPVEGWAWFDSLEAATDSFGLDIKDYLAE